MLVTQTGLQCYFSGEAVCNTQEAVDSPSSCAVLCMETVQCVDEDADDVSGCVSMPDTECNESIVKQRRLHSSALLKKEQKLSSASVDVFIKVCVFCVNCFVNVIISSVTAQNDIDSI